MAQRRPGRSECRGGLTFVASAACAQQGKGSWILRFRFGGRQREKVLGRYPDPSLKEARVRARQDRALLQQGTGIAAAKQSDNLRNGVARKNRFQHISPDTLNVALKRLPLKEVEHFTVHDMRRTARTRMAALGINRFVAERALNHKIRDVEGIYDQHDYFSERRLALANWAALLVELSTSATPG